MDAMHATMQPESSSSSQPQPMKRNEFFVDTKTTCFLCLTEIPPVINLENGDDDENKVNGQNQEEGKIFCMRAIFRYLKMNPGISFKTQLTGSLLDSASLLNKIGDWKVLLCRECVPFVNRLADVCVQLEMVQMRVDHSLQLFQEIIDKSEKDSVKVEKFRGKLTNPLETLQATIADLLRNETREKCNASLKTSLPRVSLPKIEKLFTFVGTKGRSVSHAISPPDPPVSLPQPPPPPPPSSVFPISKNVMTPASVKCKLCSRAFGSQKGITEHIRRVHPESDIHSASELISVKVNHKCHLCNVMCSSSKTLKRHMINRHHQIQTSVIFHTCNACGLKLPSKPEWIKHTRLYCDQRRTNTTLQGRIAIKLEKPPAPVQIPSPLLPPPPPPVQVPPPLPPPPPIRISPPLPTVLQPTTVTTVDLSTLMNPMPHFRTGNNEFLCSLCPVRNSNEIFRTEDQLKMHLFMEHVDYFFSPLKLPEVDKEQFEKFCYRIIENDMKPSNQQNTGKGPMPYTCVHCSTVFNGMRIRAMNAHLIQSHYPLLIPKLMEMQRKSTKQTVITPVSTPPPPPVALPLPQPLPPPFNAPLPQPPPPPFNATLPQSSPLKTQWVPKRKLKCSSCSSVFSQSSGLSRHRRLSCPGIFATSTRKTGNGHGVSSQLTDKGNVGRFQCGDCGAWFLHKIGLNRHRKKMHSANEASISVPQLPQESSDFPYVCDYCDNRFGTFRGKKNHMLTSCYKKRNHDDNTSSLSPQTWQNDQDGGFGPMVTSTFSLSTTTTATPGHSLNEGISVGVENYYDEGNYISTPAEGQVMVDQDEEEVYPGSYVSTKIEVLDFEQVQIFPTNHENSEIEEVEEMNHLYQGTMMVNEDGDEEIIYEGEEASVDPLF